MLSLFIEEGDNSFNKFIQNKLHNNEMILNLNKILFLRTEEDIDFFDDIDELNGDIIGLISFFPPILN